MILAMSKVRIFGPRPRLDEVLGTLQDLSLLHISTPDSSAPLERVHLSADQERDRTHLLSALSDVEESLEALGASLGTVPTGGGLPVISGFARWARLAGKIRRETRQLTTR